MSINFPSKVFAGRFPPCGYCLWYLGEKQNGDSGICLKAPTLTEDGNAGYMKVKFSTPTGSRPYCPYRRKDDSEG